jgi:O-antigen ligase
LFILASPLISVYQELGWDPRVGWAFFLGLRALLPIDGKELAVNSKVVLAGITFFLIAATVLRFNMASIPAEDASSAWTFLIYFLAGSVFIFAASRLIGSQRDVLRTLLCLGLSAAAVAVYAIWQGAQFYANDQYGRIGSTLINPNFLASYMSVCVMTLLSTRRLVDNQRWRIFVWSVSAAATLAVILSFSRAGMIAFLIGLVLLWATASGKFSVKKAILVAIVIVVASLSAYTGLRAYRIQRAADQMKPGQESLTEISQSMEDLTRYEAATFSLRELADHPLIGIGFGTLAAVNYQQNGFYVTTHNTPLQLLVGTGIVGMLLVAYIGKQLWRKLDKSGRALFLPVAGCFAINSLFADFLAAIEMLVPLALAYMFCRYCSRPDLPDTLLPLSRENAS